MINEKKLYLFETAKVSKSVWSLSIPSIITMLVVMIYNVVDTFFVGQLNDPNKVAAVAVATPVFLLLMALANIFGVGGSTFISRALGEKKMERVKHISSFAFYTGIFAGIICGLVFFFWAKPILMASGASQYTIEYAVDYLHIIAYGAPIIILSFILSALLRGEGAATKAMIGSLIGTISNIILDPIFILSSINIFGHSINLLGLGVKGAAIATVIGNFISVIFYLIAIVGEDSILSFSPKMFKTKDGILSGVILIGLPSSLNSILMSVSNILMNNILASYGDTAVAAMGIAMKANMLVVFVELGLSIGVQPLIGYCYGAGMKDRLKAITKYAMICNVCIGITLSAFLIWMASPIVSSFLDNKEVITLGSQMLRALSSSTTVLGIMFINEFAFQAMGKAKESLILSISRQGFVFIPFLFISNYLAGLNGIIWSQPLADIVCLFLSLFILKKILNSDSKLNAKAMPQRA